MKKLPIILAICAAVLVAFQVVAEDEEQWKDAISIKTVDTKPEPVKQDKPVISPDIKGITGIVTVSFVIDTKGEVQDAKVLKSTDEKLNTTAINTVKEWKFKPAENVGQPIPVRAMVRVRF
jgi:TonB family protein